MYEWENEETMTQRNKEALKRREQLLFFIGMKDHISSEGSSDKTIFFPRAMLVRLLHKTFNTPSLRRVKKA